MCLVEDGVVVFSLGSRASLREASRLVGLGRDYRAHIKGIKKHGQVCLRWEFYRGGTPYTKNVSMCE